MGRTDRECRMRSDGHRVQHVVRARRCLLRPLATRARASSVGVAVDAAVGGARVEQRSLLVGGGERVGGVGRHVRGG